MRAMDEEDVTIMLNGVFNASQLFAQPNSTRLLMMHENANEAFMRRVHGRLHKTGSGHFSFTLLPAPHSCFHIVV